MENIQEVSNHIMETSESVLTQTSTDETNTKRWLTNEADMQDGRLLAHPNSRNQLDEGAICVAFSDIPSVENHEDIMATPARRKLSKNKTESNVKDEKIVCQWYIRTATCLYGDGCRYYHPPGQKPPVLNHLGYPIRPGAPQCAFYLRHWRCEFGATCKYDHPTPVEPKRSSRWKPGECQEKTMMSRGPTHFSNWDEEAYLGWENTQMMPQHSIYACLVGGPPAIFGPHLMGHNPYTMQYSSVSYIPYHQRDETLTAPFGFNPGAPENYYMPVVTYPTTVEISNKPADVAVHSDSEHSNEWDDVQNEHSWSS